MKYSKDVRKRLVLSVFFLLIMAIGLISKFSPNTFSSFATIENVWSGEVATSFYGGNGTEENPFLISNGEELAFFEQVINSENNTNYLSASYELTTDINMADLPFRTIGNENNYFSGEFDGNGYSISNLNLVSDNYNFSFFYGLDKGEVRDVNLKNVKINVEDSSSFKLGVLAINVKNQSVINNLSINNAIASVTDSSDESKTLGGLVHTITDSSVQNSYIDVSSDYEDFYSVAYTSKNTKYSNVLVKNDTYEYTSDETPLSGVITLGDLDTFLKDANESIKSKNYEWINEDGNVFINQNVPAVVALFMAPRNITTHESGIFDNIVYVNDLSSDYNYYIGLNYTTSSDNKTPTMDNKKIYTDKNLVNVQITYSGIDSTRLTEAHGYVSLNERQDTYIYYKTMPVHKGAATSGAKQDYVEFELIDNPYTDRPNGMGFNGWVTEYPNAQISFNSDIYVRSVRVPVTYDSNGYPNDIVIDFNASWVEATVYEKASNTAFSTAIENLHDVSMQELKTRETITETRPVYTDTLDMSNYYTRVSVPRGKSQAGYYSSTGSLLSGRCNSWYGDCTVYAKQTGTNYNPSLSYYSLVNGSMQRATISGPPFYVGDETIVTEKIYFNENSLMSPYYEKVVLNRNSSKVGYYDEYGVYQDSGTCTSSSCTYYKLLQAYDEKGNLNTFDSSKTYYYLVTRDTNIIVLTANTSSAMGTAQTKPLTITGLYNGVNYNVTWNLSSSFIAAYNDLVLENILIESGSYVVVGENTPPSTSSTSSGWGGDERANNFYGRWKNVKIGRGIRKSSTSRVNFDSVMGGDNAQIGSSGDINKYRLIVESGYYNALSITGGTATSRIYIDGTAIYGNDYDRVNNNNSNLDIYYCASGSWGNNVYKNGITSIALHTIVKSGKFGSRRPTSYLDNNGNINTNTSNYTYGIYVGGRQGGANFTGREAIIEGGWVYNLIGGPLAQESNKDYNDSYIYVKGGEVDAIIGGAGRTKTYGNRIIQVTDGLINNSVFGGSNGITSQTSSGGWWGDSSDQTGELDGDTYIYIGGNSTIGKQEYVSSNTMLFGFEAGSVFGIGNGQSSSSDIGTANNSNIIIDGNARILRNVYGGGNYGAVGLQSASKTNINLIGGTVLGNVYGGGNNNGSGTSDYASQVTINVDGGTVEGSVYGGSNEKGIIYGSTNINLYNGTILTDVYGGGYGGYADYNHPGTYVKDEVTIQAGRNSSDEQIVVNGSIYGGSAFGTVNGTDIYSGKNYNKGITINFDKGIVRTAIYGGGEGNSRYTPRVYGDILVNVNGGNIGEVYGGNNASGTPSGEININLNKGIIKNVYGGGRNASVTSNHIYLNGSTVLESIFGGSNYSGAVNVSNILTTSGSTANIFGGNNLDGNTLKSNVTIKGGKITDTVYGGGFKATTGETYVYLKSSDIPNVYGGGADADITTSTNVYLQGSTVGNLFGGSNAGGNIDRANIDLADGTVTNVYGGNNEDGTTNESFITQGGATILNNIFGGGNKIGVNTTHIDLYSGNINNVYGGSNQSGEVGNTYIKTPSVNRDDLSINITKEKAWDIEPYKSHSHLYVNIKNDSNVDIVKWNVSFKTTDAILGENWSSTIIEAQDNEFKFNQDNVNDANNPMRVYAHNSLNLDFYTYNDTPYEKFDILSYKIIGYDSSNNRYEFEYSDSGEKSLDLEVGNLYGGNNLGGTTKTPNIDIDRGKITNIFGGGNQAVVTGNTVVNITDANILTSIYGGGNQATVYGSTLVNVDGKTTVAASVFGGGNHGAVGLTSTDNSISTVNIAGATIGKNVYGGCNTSEIYGFAKVNIGASALENNSLNPGDIQIGGTVFGGGEANEGGSEIFDFDHISVTRGIDININGTGYEGNNRVFRISGSIFGSGNASSSSGPSNIYIGKLGTRKHPNTSISIQRADEVVIDNSSIELIGITDSTNFVSNKLYSLNRIGRLKIKNETDLLLRNNANLLQEFNSLVDVNGEEVKAKVDINDDAKKVTYNVNNRLYMLAGSNLNVAINQDATDFGNVYGMTFFGMYNTYGNGSYVYGMYDSSMSYGSAATAGDVITDGSYVRGLHALNHDITVDGFYTNYIDDDFTVLTTAYIEPTPPNSNFYIWEIGTPSIKYEIELVAARYSSLGTAILNMPDFPDGNVTFNLIGFNGDGLTEGVTLKDSNFVSKLSSTQEEADSVLGLAMKSETIEWTNQGTTKFMKDDKSSYSGTTEYKTDNQSLAPNMTFYLYHAKNISPDLNLGSVVISLQALIPKDEVEDTIKLVTITVKMHSVEIVDGDAYDASITYSKKYDLPVATGVNITNRSQFTTYFALLAQSDRIDEFYGKNHDNYHALISSYALPVGTKITMIDYGYSDDNPNYYYYIVDEADYASAVAELASENEIAYRLSKFIRMDSVDKNNTYDDKANNEIYYHDNINFVNEEFIFIFDFQDTSVTGNYLNNSILFELREHIDREETVFNVWGQRRDLMKYSLYDSSNEVLVGNYTFDNNYFYYDTPKDISTSTRISYDQTELRQAIVDTNYESSSLGLNIEFFDVNGIQTSSSQLSSASISMDGRTYYVDSNGVFRIKLADKVSNLNKDIVFTTGDTLPVGNYKMRVSLFASNDGLHNSGDKEPSVTEYDIVVVGNNNMIIVNNEDEIQLVDGKTGLNALGTNEEIFDITYSSVLENPNIRVTLYKRSTIGPNSSDYIEYNAREMFTNTFNYPLTPYKASSRYEYMVSVTPTEVIHLNYKLHDNLTSGTYKLVFRLYDNNQLIDEDYKYIIVRKNV